MVEINTKSVSELPPPPWQSTPPWQLILAHAAFIILASPCLREKKWSEGRGSIPDLATAWSIFFFCRVWAHFSPPLMFTYLDTYLPFGFLGPKC